ncbi:MAG: hypothetical protein ACRYG5_01610 [Janthinobacterium lividum]
MKFEIGQRVRNARGEVCIIAEVEVIDGAPYYRLRRAWGALMRDWCKEDQLSAFPASESKHRPTPKRKRG